MEIPADNTEGSQTAVFVSVCGSAFVLTGSPPHVPEEVSASTCITAPRVALASALLADAVILLHTMSREVRMDI